MSFTLSVTLRNLRFYSHACPAGLSSCTCHRNVKGRSSDCRLSSSRADERLSWTLAYFFKGHSHDHLTTVRHSKGGWTRVRGHCRTCSGPARPDQVHCCSSTLRLYWPCHQPEQCGLRYRALDLLPLSHKMPQGKATQSLQVVEVIRILLHGDLRDCPTCRRKGS